MKAKPWRLPAPPVVLPDIGYESVVIADWLMERERPQRRPEQTAKVLALAIKLHHVGQPWPVRRQVAAHTGVSLPQIDVVVSQRQANGDINVRTTTVKGNINRSRDSVVTQKFIQPSQELLDVVRKGEIARGDPLPPGPYRIGTIIGPDGPVDWPYTIQCADGRAIAGHVNSRECAEAIVAALNMRMRHVTVT